MIIRESVGIGLCGHHHDNDDNPYCPHSKAEPMYKQICEYYSSFDFVQ